MKCALIWCIIMGNYNVLSSIDYLIYNDLYRMVYRIIWCVFIIALLCTIYGQTTTVTPIVIVYTNIRSQSLNKKGFLILWCKNGALLLLYQWCFMDGVQSIVRTRLSPVSNSANFNAFSKTSLIEPIKCPLYLRRCGGKTL